MPKLRRSLFIGLGGTGMTSILNTKKMLYDNYGDIPPMIGFLGIDTDGPGFETRFVTAKDGTRISLTAAEVLSIVVPNPRDIYARNTASDTFDWMPEHNVFALDQLRIGAGQVRTNGRFALTNRERDVEDRLRTKVNQINDASIIDSAKYELLGAETEVHVVFSIGGGTGAGTFLNVAYLLKRLFPMIKVSGYAVLSDVFRAMMSGAQSARVRPNAMGALMDTDFLTHLSQNSEPVELRWMRSTQKIDERPFQALYLIDNRNDNNDSFSTVTPLCEMISLALVTSIGELGVAMDSISDNVTKQIASGTMDIRDKKAWVASFGVSEIVFDGKRLSEIYAQKARIQIVNMLLNGGCDDPNVIANNWIDNEHIRENLGKDDVIDYFCTPEPRYMFTTVDDPTNPKPECITYLSTIALEKPTDLDAKLEELKQRIDVSLTKLMAEQANRECGVFLCENILKAINNQVEACDFEMKQEITDLEANLPRLESGLDTVCKELERCMGTFFKKGKDALIEDTVNAVAILARQKREIARRKMARMFYNWLRTRVQESLKRVDQITRNLQAVRDASSRAAQDILQSIGNVSFFEFDLSTELAAAVECPAKDIVFNDFIIDIKSAGGVPSFAAMTSSETGYTLMSFIEKLPRIKDYREMTVEEVLRTMNADQRLDLLKRALRKAEPLLPYTYRGFDADVIAKPVDSYYVGVADKKNTVFNKETLATVLTGAQSIEYSEIGLADRIIIYRQLGVLPVFTLKSLDNYWPEYNQLEESKPGSSHFDAGMYARMMKERYSLMPKNPVDASKILGAWTDAVIHGLVRFNPSTGQYQIPSRGLGGKALRKWLVDMGATRAEAFRFFEDNFDVLEGEVTAALERLDQPGPDNQLLKNIAACKKAIADNTYLETISGSPIPMSEIETYPDEYDLIEKEMVYLTDNL